MASGSYGGARGGGGRAGRNGAGRRYTAAQNRRIRENYTAPARSLRRGAGGAIAVPSRWLM